MFAYEKVVNQRNRSFVAVETDNKRSEIWHGHLISSGVFSIILEFLDSTGEIMPIKYYVRFISFLGLHSKCFIQTSALLHG